MSYQVNFHWKRYTSFIYSVASAYKTTIFVYKQNLPNSIFKNSLSRLVIYCCMKVFGVVRTQNTTFIRWGMLRGCSSWLLNRRSFTTVFCACVYTAKWKVYFCRIGAECSHYNSTPREKLCFENSARPLLADVNKIMPAAASHAKADVTYNTRHVMAYFVVRKVFCSLFYACYFGFILRFLFGNV